MDSWFRGVGKPSLEAAVARTCDRFADDLAKTCESFGEDFERKWKAHRQAEDSEKRKRAEELHRWKTEASRVDPSNTPSEIAGAAKNDSSSCKVPRPNRETSSRPSAPQEYTVLEDKYNHLHYRYNMLQKAHKDTLEKYRSSSKSCKLWEKHSEELDQQVQARGLKIKKLEAKLAVFSARSQGVPPNGLGSSPPGNGSNPQSNMEMVEPISKEDKGLPIADTTQSCSTEDDSSRGAPDVTAQAGKAPDDTALADITSDLPPLPLDQTRPVEDDPAIETEQSSDAPIVVSERCLRKRKIGDDTAEGGPPQTRIKTEDGSDPILTNEQHCFAPHESIDFDDEERRVETPRKPREPVPPHSPTRIVTHAPSTDATDLSSRVSGRSSSGSPVLKPINANIQPVRHGTKYKQGEKNPPRRSSSGSHVLKPISANIQPVQHGTKYKQGRKNPLSDCFANKLDSLAEDGDQQEASNSDKQPPKACSGSRLADLMNPPSRGQKPPALFPVLSSTGQPREFSIFSGRGYGMPQKRVLPFGKELDRRVSNEFEHSTTPLAKSQKRAEDTLQLPNRPEDDVYRSESSSKSVRLRELPLQDLKLDDFKVNPKANNGYDFAFSEVVRNKDERTNLSGCVREECCGQAFRGLARSYRGETGSIAFVSLLEEYLGDESRKLGTMTREEKERLWLDAKTRELADKHGKHRHRFERMASPPGFWRADFPSTQELQQDRQEADKMQKQTIEQRWREAMRPGGRWIFRDEQS